MVRWGTRVALVVVLAVAGAVLGLRLAGPVERETALGVVALRVAPAIDGEVDAYIPLADWGVRADAFQAPLILHVEPRSIDRQAVIRAAGGEESVLRAAQADGERAAGDAMLRALGWAVGGATGLALLVAAALRRGRRETMLLVATVTVVASAVSTAALLRAERSFDIEAFETPRFYARGAELAQLLKVAGATEGKAYRSQVDRTLSSYATLLGAGGGTGLAEAGQRALLVSDLHGNTLVLDTLERLASGGPVFFAGDFGQAGTVAEARAVGTRIAAPERVVAVSGNHDSRIFMRHLAERGVTVLTETGRIRRDGSVDGRPVQEIDGLRVAGFSDPLESRTGDPNDPDRIFSFSERPNGEQEYEQAKRALIAWFRTLEPRPDVVMVHQNGLAQALARELRDEARLLILTGHDHRQHIDRHGNVLVVDAGSVGAGGILGAGKDSIGVAQLELAGTGPWPRLIDLIALEPFSGAARADRILPAAPEACERITCHEVDG